MKNEIRTVLNRTNPLIIQNIDEGKKEIGIMFSQSNLLDILDLSKYPEFNEYLDIQPTGTSSNSNTNIFGSHINDVIDGYLNGYVLFPTDKLMNNN